jgi:acyl-CoA dehydrogenase
VLARSVQLVAALGRVFASAVQYAGERQPFGPSLGKFQAIQLEPAEMAGEVTALTDTAVQSLERRPPDFVLAAAAAKVRAGRRWRSWPGSPTRCTG